MNDFYPTPKKVTLALLNNINWDPATRILDPACGDNDIVKVLKTRFTSVVGTDIQTGTNFLKMPIQRDKFDAVITNPPFSLAGEFVNHAINYPYVAMFLKSTFWHAKSRTELFRKRRPSKIVALNWKPQFDPNSESASTIDFIWSIWKPDATVTEYTIANKPL